MIHDGSSALAEAELQVAVLAVAAIAYVTAARRVGDSDERHARRTGTDRGTGRRRGSRRTSATVWQAGRTALWLSGVVAASAGAVVLSLGGHDLRLHVAGHLLLGMLAPVLLATAAPVTLALRALPRDRARALARLLRSWPLAVLTHPAVAALVEVGGLWLLYRTDLLAEVPPLLLHVHMLLAGYLLAYSLIGPDPAPHRPGLAVRAGVLVAAVAAHDVLAKLLYAAPPPGVPTAQAELAGQLMYYGAVPVHLALLGLLGREWFAAQERRRVSARPAVPRRPTSVRAAWPR